MHKLLINISLMAGLSLPAIAQTPVGTAEVNGRQVIIYDNNSWAFAAQENSTEDCFNIIEGLFFCGHILGWGATTKLSPDAAASFRLDDRNYFMVIHEGLGIEEGISLDFMQEAVLRNVAVGAGVNEQDVAVHSVDEFQLFDDTARRIVYGAKVSGLDFLYYNTVFVAPNDTLQFLTFTIGKEPKPEFMRTHTDAINALRQN